MTTNQTAALSPAPSFYFVWTQNGIHDGDVYSDTAKLCFALEFVADEDVRIFRFDPANPAGTEDVSKSVAVDWWNGIGGRNMPNGERDAWQNVIGEHFVPGLLRRFFEPEIVKMENCHPSNYRDPDRMRDDRQDLAHEMRGY